MKTQGPAEQLWRTSASVCCTVAFYLLQRKWLGGLLSYLFVLKLWRSYRLDHPPLLRVTRCSVREPLHCPGRGHAAHVPSSSTSSSWEVQCPATLLPLLLCLHVCKLSGVGYFFLPPPLSCIYLLPHGLHWNSKSFVLLACRNEQQARCSSLIPSLSLSCRQWSSFKRAPWTEAIRPPPACHRQPASSLRAFSQDRATRVSVRSFV